MSSQKACETVTGNPLSPRERDRERGPKKLLTRARALRQQSSEAEKVLWEHLRARRLNGYKFRRQVVIETYIVDFICVEAKLVVEADGGQHTGQMNYDAVRTARLEQLGYRIIRFWNHEILAELDTVLEQISSALMDLPHPNPLPVGEGVNAHDFCR